MPRAARPTPCRGKWRIRWIDHEGKRQSDVHETYNEAERQLRKRQLEADEVKRGQRRAAPIDHTGNDLFDYWLKHRAPRKRSRKDDESIIAKHLRPAFGKLKLRAITSEKLDEYRAAREDLAPASVWNQLKLLSTMLRLAVEELRWLLERPVIRKPPLDPDDDIDPPWLKTEDEIRRLLDAARAEAVPGQVLTEVPFVLYATAVYTGMRAGELAGLRWDDVDLQRRAIAVRRSYAGKTKTRASRRHVPIVDALLPILIDWHARRPGIEGGWVFPGQTGTMLHESARVFQEILHRCLDRAGFARPTTGRHVHAIHFHSLRHTFACRWRLNGGPLDDLIRVLGHTTRSMTERYVNIGAYPRPEHFALFPAPSTAAAAG